MNEPTTHAEFAEHSYSWQHIESPALDRAIEDLVYRDDTRILDLGCGGGRVVNYHVHRGANPFNIVGVDSDLNSLKIAKRKFPEAAFVRNTLQDFQPAEDSFDLVTATFSLRYLSNPELDSLLAKIRMALSDGGLFVLLDVHPARQVLTDKSDKTYTEGPREVATPWGEVETYHFRRLGTYVTSIASCGLTIRSLDECTITENAQKANPEKFASYIVSPARFIISALNWEQHQ